MIKIKNGNFLIFFLVIFLSAFSIAACDNQQSKSNQNENKQRVDQQTQNVSNQVSLEGKFTPPNFKVDEFKIKTDKNSVEFEIFYKVNSELYSLLKEVDNNYYFQLKLPGNISSIIKKDSTGLVPGAKMKPNDLLNYKVTLNFNLVSPLTKNEEKNVLQNKEGYGLYIYDQDKDAIHFFDDVELFSTVQ